MTRASSRAASAVPGKLAASLSALLCPLVGEPLSAAAWWSAVLAIFLTGLIVGSLLTWLLCVCFASPRVSADRGETTSDRELRWATTALGSAVTLWTLSVTLTVAATVEYYQLAPNDTLLEP